MILSAAQVLQIPSSIPRRLRRVGALREHKERHLRPPEQLRAIPIWIVGHLAGAAVAYRL